MNMTVDMPGRIELPRPRVDWNKFAALMLACVVALGGFFVWKVSEAADKQVQACSFLIDGKNYSYTPDLFDRLQGENATCVKFCKTGLDNQTIIIER